MSPLETEIFESKRNVYSERGYKMKKISRYVAILILLAIVTTNPVQAAAFEAVEQYVTLPGGDLPNDDPQTAWEQYQEMLQDESFSDEECQEFYERVINKQQGKQRTAITMKVLTVPYFKQDNEYYCGPATAKQTITYFNGTAESQSEIWPQIKYIDPNNEDSQATDGDKLRIYVNDKQDEHIYGLVYPSDATDMATDIFNDLNSGAPMILWVKVTAGGNWKYNTVGGHFLNASGINTGGTLVQVTDPYIEYANLPNYSTGKYWVTIEEAYSATVARKIGYYY